MRSTHVQARRAPTSRRVDATIGESAVTRREATQRRRQRRLRRRRHGTSATWPEIARGRSLSTHPRALVIAGAGAPASIFLVLSPIIQPKPPNSYSNTHRWPDAVVLAGALPMSEKRRARSFDLSAPHAHTTPKPALTTRRFATPPTHRTSATDSS